MSQLTSEQRYTICALLEQGHKQKDIARVINKDPSVVSREIKRNSDKRNNVYSNKLAQRKANARKKDKPKFIRFTSELKILVESLIKDYYSPEQICGRVKFINGKTVSIETIYRYIWLIREKEALCISFFAVRVGNIENEAVQRIVEAF